MSEILTRITPAGCVTVPSIGRLTHIDVTAHLTDGLEVTVYAHGADHRATHLIEFTAADGETTWFTDNERDAPIPLWLCRQVNTAIECAARSLQTLVDLEAEEVAR